MSANVGFLKDRLMSMADVAVTLGTSVRTVWRLVASGVLPQPVKVGRSARMCESDIVAYLDRLKEQRQGG